MPSTIICRSSRRGCSFHPLERRTLLSVPAGPELRVNTATALDQEFPAIAMDAAGNFVVVWSTLLGDGPTTGNYYDVFAQRFDAAGAPLGGEFRVNSYTTGNQLAANVVMNSTGEFIVTWGSSLNDNRGGGVYAQRFDAAGAPIGDEIHINSDRRQYGSATAMNGSGGFVAILLSNGQDGSGFGLYGRRFDATGTPLGNEFRVNTYTVGDQTNASIAMTPAGDFVVTWTGPTQGWSTQSVYAQRYSADCTRQGGEFLVSESILRDQGTSRIAIQENGDFVIAWQGIVNPLYDDIFVRRFNADGTPTGAEFRANNFTTDTQSNPSIAMDSEGRFIVAWSSDLQDDGTTGVYWREFNSDGTPVGDEARINTYTPDYQTWPKLAMSDDGDFVVTWESNGQDGSGKGVYAQRYITPPSVTASSFHYQTSPMSLRFGFSEDVSASLATSDFALVNLTTGQVVPTTFLAIDYDGVTDVATVRFPGYAGGILPDGDYRATIAAGDVTDVAGHTLLSDAALQFHHLGGDANRDRAVDVSDLAILATNWRQSPRTFSDGDFNLDAAVDAADLEILASRWQQRLSPTARLARVVARPAPIFVATRTEARLRWDRSALPDLLDADSAQDAIAGVMPVAQPPAKPA